MAKQGMKRPEISKAHSNNTEPPVPAIQGRAKHGHHKANPIVAGTEGPQQKLWHDGSDLARDNLTQDIPYADLQDM